MLVDATAQMATGVEGLLCVAETELAVNDSHRIQFAVQQRAADILMTDTDGGRGEQRLMHGGVAEHCPQIAIWPMLLTVARCATPASVAQAISGTVTEPPGAATVCERVLTTAYFVPPRAPDSRRGLLPRREDDTGMKPAFRAQ